jgi:hypothetical protein
MDITKVLKHYQYHLPYTKQDTVEIFNHGYAKALQDVLSLCQGEVINGSLRLCVQSEMVEQLQDKVRDL